MEIFEVSFESSILIILLLLFAGLLAGSESALTSLSRLLIEEIVEAKPNYKIKFQNFVANPAKFLNVLLLVRKSCELTATATVAVYFVEGSSNKGLALFWAIALMVAISYVVVGVGPRTLGKQRAIKWARLAITIAVVLSKLLGPLTTLLIRIGNALTPGKGFKSGPFSTEAEFRDLVDQASESGFVEESEREMIHSVFDLGETLVRELMVPRTEMVWIEADKTVRQGLSLALRSGFTRIPVISENLDNVVGIAYVKDLAKRVHDNPNSEVNEKVEEHLRKATFVPENKTADDLLKQMQRDQIHMAIVVDEYGGTAGIITIEDILEEIVGEIADEYDDNESEEVEWLNENKARISARLHVEDFAEKFDSSFTDEEIEDVDSIGGLIAKHLGRVPIPGSTITVPGWKLTAERPSGRRHRIATVLVEKIEESGKISDQL
ncbi:MAG: HlyC/CorC family transporter [Actinobacteria bacterium]|nr:HlyC/CorC family transporter [Actinomycetota bacterium]NCU96042.1 HlyC/CorC family transporter [Actinomycetota bacterium]NCZ76469.1 HlyC/CorC family transporter [Actinomycetota bacterium]